MCVDIYFFYYNYKQALKAWAICDANAEKELGQQAGFLGNPLETEIASQSRKNLTAPSRITFDNALRV